MSDPIGFLRARLDEDEVAARSIGIDVTDNSLRLIVSPTRLLAEVAAKRRIVEAHSPAPEGYLQHHPWSNFCRSCCSSRPYRVEPVRVPCGTLKLLLLPYADHPDFDPAWRAA